MLQAPLGVVVHRLVLRRAMQRYARPSISYTSHASQPSRMSIAGIFASLKHPEHELKQSTF